MKYGPIARIVLRYGAGVIFGASPLVGEQLAANPDLVMVVSGLIALAVEGFYRLAKRKGWDT